MAEGNEKTPLLASRDSRDSQEDSAQYSVRDIMSPLGNTIETDTQVDFNYQIGPSSHQHSVSIDKVQPIALSWEKISVYVKVPGKRRPCCGDLAQSSGKPILKDVTGVVQTGTLLAILGASGAGKSTLLNVLTNRNIKSYNLSGDIRVNGWPIGDGIKNLSAYVQQDDIFISTLTVREQLQFRALLRMDKRLSRERRLARVEEVISEMGLSKCADTRIGDVGGGKKGISGGERKRLSFASEALTNPPIFFCDEPTSGLDSFMAQNIVHTLQKMALKGRMILCTIHQPSSELFSMFDQILLLAEGRTAFFGSSTKAIDFFQRLAYPCPTNYNPADHFILTLAILPGREEESRNRTHTICDVFNTSDDATQVNNQIEELKKNAISKKQGLLVVEISTGDSIYEASWLTQFRYLFWRSWISMFRDVMLFRVRVIQVCILGVILGLIYLQIPVDQKGVMSINGAIFLLILNSTFTNMFAVLNSFPVEMSVFFREYGAGLYRSDSYYLAKTFAEVPLFVLISLIFSAVTYWMIGLYASLEAYLIATGVLLLVSNVAVALSYLISTICGSVTLALSVSTPILIPFMIFGGLFVNSGNIPVYFVWLQYLSWFKYANEIMMVNQWQNIDHIPCNNSTVPVNGTQPPPGAGCLYRTGNDVLRYTSFKKDEVVLDVCLLVALQIVLRFLSLIVLIIKAKRSKE